MSAAGVDTAAFIVGIEHELTPWDWTITLHFRPVDTTTAATITNGSGGPSAGPADLIAPVSGPMAYRIRPALSVANVTWTSLSLDTYQVGDQITWDSTNRWFAVPMAGRYLMTCAVA